MLEKIIKASCQSRNQEPALVSGDVDYRLEQVKKPFAAEYLKKPEELSLDWRYGAGQTGTTVRGITQRDD